MLKLDAAKQPAPDDVRSLHGARAAPYPSADPVAQLQQAGNQAVQALLQFGPSASERSLAGAPLATTLDGRTAFAPQAFNDRRLPEIAAHEAVHRAQFRATGRQAGSVAQLERDAVAGSRSLLARRSHTPAFRAPSGLALQYDPNTQVVIADHAEQTAGEENAKSLDTLGPGTSGKRYVSASVSREGADTERQTTTIHLEASGAGAHGSIASATNLVFDYNPANDYVIPRDELGNPLKDDPLAVYPVELRFARTLHLTDEAGRTCDVEIAATVFFSHDTFRRETHIFGPVTFEQLMGLQGDQASFAVSLHGKGPIQSYNTAFPVSQAKGGLRSLNGIASVAAGYLPLPGEAHVHILAGWHGGFVLPNLTAGEQFSSLESYLEEADKETMSRRVMADLAMLTRDKAPAPDKSDPDEIDMSRSGTMDGLLGSVIMGIAYGLLIVGAIFAVVAAFPEIALGTAIASVMGTLVATSFLYALINRYKLGVASGHTNPISIFSSAFLDTIGYSAIYGAVTDKDVLTGEELHQSTSERIGSGIAGGITMFMIALGIRETVKARVPEFAKPDTPGDTAVPSATRSNSAVDATQFSDPDDYLNALRSAPSDGSPAGPSWDNTRFPNGPRAAWQPGDPIDMPDPNGVYPEWRTARPRFWRNRAAIELEARANGSRAQSLGSTDPISAMSDADLQAFRDTPTWKVHSPLDPVSGRPMEIEHFGVQQQVSGWLEDAGFDENQARRLTGGADPGRLLDVSPAEHAFFDKEAHGFGRRRADVNGNMWTGTPTADPRVANPLTFMKDSEIVEIATRAQSDPAINLANSPQLRAAMRAEAAARGLLVLIP